MSVGITLTRTAAAAEEVIAAAEEDTATSCPVPVALRYRVFRNFEGGTGETSTGGGGWSYGFPVFDDVLVYNSATGDTIPTDPEIVLGGDSFEIPMVDHVPTVLGVIVVDLIDEGGIGIVERARVDAECTGVDDVTPVIDWTVTYQEDGGVWFRAIPNVVVNPDWQLIVTLSDDSEYNAGVLSITATDNFTEGGPFVFGPLEITLSG